MNRRTVRTEVETVQHDAAAAGSVVLDRYALLEELGSGGFGAVWLAHDQRLERPVAVKRIPIRGGARAERAEREALAAARLSHPAVVSLYEAGRDEDAVYLVSELVRGATLGELLADGALSDRDVLLIGMALCDALAHAHSRGVIHRDVKPGNVLIPETPADGVVAKLTDFGIARIAGDDALTATGDVVGTLAYMAPEQAEGRGASAASDLYALALVLYEALAGINPVRQSNAAATARRMGTRLPPLRRLRRDLPRGLAAAIDAAVLPDPALRGSLDGLRLALAEALGDVGDEPGVVAPPAWAAVPTRTLGRPARASPIPAPARAPFAVEENEAVAHPPAPARVAIPARIAAGLLAGGLVLAALTLVAQRPPLDPPAIAGLAAALVALLPRLGWLAAAAALTAWLGAQGGDGWWAVGLAALPLPLLVPRAPAWWSAPGGAVALGYLGVPAAWPAVAGQARGLWTRAVLGAAGYWWIALVQAVLGKRLITAPAADLKHLLTRADLAVAGVWALAAGLLPLLVRGRNAVLDLLGACVWAAGLALGTQAVTRAAGAGDPHGLVGGAALAALLAVLAMALRRP
ncbi:MAG: eukaryotic-like serine/threonine-protein kinase [Solirubrobacteraceae bacterium]|nr:eukaryotic-like serine/threonine-protein kinase [Solirubrobacteraceae bacterium]